jgi:hypothetical protein
LPNFPVYKKKNALFEDAIKICKQLSHHLYVMLLFHLACPLYFSATRILHIGSLLLCKGLEKYCYLLVGSELLLYCDLFKCGKYVNEF